MQLRDFVLCSRCAVFICSTKSGRTALGEYKLEFNLLELQIFNTGLQYDSF